MMTSHASRSEPGAEGHRRSHACGALSPDQQVACLRAAARGDLAGLGLLYALFAPGLTRSAEAWLVRPSDAPDIVHDIFLRLCDRADQFDPDRGSVWSWLAAITHHACVDHNRWRRVRRRARRRMLAGRQTTTDDALDVLALSTLQRRLSSLPKAHQRVVEATFWEDSSFALIAGREGIPLNTVKSRSIRAMRALRSDFEATEMPSVDHGADGLTEAIGTALAELGPP